MAATRVEPFTTATDTSATMIPDLLPLGAVGAAAYEAQWDTTLLPEELTLVERAVPKRQREFAAARNCARRALSALGESPGPILAGPRREPLWPRGVVGSITHCSGYCAAVVTYRERLLGLGIDAELNLPLPADLRDSVCTPEELRDFDLRGITADRLGADPAMLVFSAKESIYKAWYPITGVWLGFENATLALDLQRQCFSVRFDLDALTNTLVRNIDFQGRFAVTERHIFTLVVAGSVAAGAPRTP
jgi:4'-phosphopantetheinyl transferase EntD